jgi:hypothetical protein
VSTARDLIKNSLRLIGALSTGETPSADESADGLLALNNLIDSWSNEKLIINQFIREEFTLTPGTQSYTVGATGALVTARPLKIESASLEIQSADPYEVPMEIIDLDEWSRISDKSIQSSIPTKLYVEGSFPNSTIYLWPVPATANKVVLYSRKPIASFATIDDDVELPPGYLRALTYNLAMEIAPEYGKEPLSTVVMIAREAKENIKRTNIQSYVMGFDLAISNRDYFDYETGE